MLILLLVKPLKNLVKGIEGQGEKQADTLESLKPKELKVIKDNKSDDKLLI